MRYRVACLLLLVACGDSAGPPATRRVDVLSPRPMIRVGEFVHFRANAIDANEQILTGRTPAWSSSDSLVASVTAQGVVTARGAGQTTITAVIEGVAGSSPLSVTLRPALTVQVQPASDSLMVGDSLQLNATPRDSAGFPAIGHAITWRSSDPTKAVVSPTGVVRALGVGGVAITALADGRTGGAFLSAHVAPTGIEMPDTIDLDAGVSVILRPRLTGPGGVIMADRPVSYASTNNQVVVVGHTGGLTTLAPGTADVITQCCGNSVFATTHVRVSPGSPALVQLGAPLTANLEVGDSARQTVTVRDARQFATAATPLWLSRDTSVLRVVADAGGRAVTMHARSPGRSWIVATLGLIADSQHITVNVPVSRMLLGPDTITIPMGSLFRLFAAILNMDGTNRADVSPQLLFEQPGIVELNNGFLQPIAPGVTRLMAQTAYNGVTYHDTVIVHIIPRGTVIGWFVPAPMTRFGDYTSTLSLSDSMGNTMSVGHDVIVTSSDSSIVEVLTDTLVNVTTSRLLTFRAHRPGQVTITASADGRRSHRSAMVADRPVSTVSLALSNRMITAGDSVAASVMATDIGGGPRPYAIAWSSSDSAVAVPRGGYVVGLTGGTAIIRARVDHRMDADTVVVRTTAGPSIASVTPSLLMPDSIATITGSGFDPVATANVVLVDGVAATVLSASTSQLTVRLAPATAWQCAMNHAAPVMVQSSAGVAAVTAQFVAARRLNVPAGSSVHLRGSDLDCVELPVGTYQLAVLNATLDPAHGSAFELRVRYANQNPVPSSVREPLLPARLAPTVVDPSRLRRVSPEVRATHRRLLDGSARLARNAGPPARLLQAAPREMSSVGDSIGALVRFRMPAVDRADFCASYRPVSARRVYRGTRVEIYEDVAGLLAGTIDGALTQLGQEFDNVMWPILVANFGDPLALDQLLDANGRITVLLSPRVAAYAAGFVVSCDFYPESTAPSSNTGEIIYLFDAEPAPAGFPGGNGYWFRWQARSVLMHEAKHVAAFAQRLSLGAPFEESWLEEGTAVIAEELYARALSGAQWKSNAGYQQTLYCEVRPNTGTCNDRPLAMYNAFASLWDTRTATPARRSRSAARHSVRPAARTVPSMAVPGAFCAGASITTRRARVPSCGRWCRIPCGRGRPISLRAPAGR